MSRYDYEDLRAAALRADASAADLSALANWLDQYDPRAWNGECYDIDDGRELWPVYQETAPDEFEIVGYEIR